MSFVTDERTTTPDTNKRSAEVIIVGAGAVGLLTALKLGRAGVDTIVLEAYNEILHAPRAIGYQPVVVQELRTLGIYERLKEVGAANKRGVTWREQGGKPLATMPATAERLTLGQDKLSMTVLSVLREECPSVKVIFGQRCVGIEQEGGKVRVMTTRDEEDHIFESKFLVGCDGANSSVRRMCMIPFEGFTWRNFRFTAADVAYDFVGHCGFPESNFVVDPENWAVIAKTGREDIWRVCYGKYGTFFSYAMTQDLGLASDVWYRAGERPNLSSDEQSMNERAPSRIMEFLQPMNKDGIFDYKITRLKPYWAHQRCAETYRKGNVLLAGDAAHSNNPIGGLGLTSGILDSVVIGNALVRHLRSGEPQEIVTQAVEARRQTWMEFVNPTSQQNFRRLFSVEEADRTERETLFEKINGKDPAFFAKAATNSSLMPDNFERSASRL